MKIDARNIMSLLQGPIKFRVYLIYGENSGLVRERASQLVKKVAGRLDDPFQICVLNKESHERLREEATALSLMGGQRAIWVREAVDSLNKPLELFCNLYPTDIIDPSSFDSIIIIEAGSLSPKSPLRILAEKHPLIASIPCYAETGRSLEETVRFLLGKKRIGSDAFRYLVAILGADRALIRNEIEKLLLYVGQDSEITLIHVQQAIGDAGEYSVDDVVYAVMSGQTAIADKALNKALKEGVNMIALTRSLLQHTDRLLQARFLLEEGTPAKLAISKLSPPVFFKRTDSFLKALDSWNSQSLSLLLRYVQKLEYLCKQTATPAEVLCQHFMLTVSGYVQGKKISLDERKLFSNL
ncbi:DNA polymerase III subunit delta [Commensalibacter papalotli (ex Botero et al. 2024)]|uniref:DNA polymerase III subunit delta n=1 Tax=Commensalibacter papalotli (ex Botero et al. 2024) TaxID=2972766 RepID=A0ABN8W7H2_9PROT|nr:DNA polymerase III subunit delta [Commensalibacter papalotli (ex Botero et al. 2024)]CAI3933676.1 DNA polymerase III [Commensalibacter papalotli (ex Botero et al. 2024)]CAI3949717.1 DNA polymerase III [Commensalibacter papalotli (ex Botero et al. 2024)]